MKATRPTRQQKAMSRSYLAGATVKMVATEFGVPHYRVRRALDLCGVTLRTFSEAFKLDYQRGRRARPRGPKRGVRPDRAATMRAAALQRAASHTEAYRVARLLSASIRGMQAAALEGRIGRPEPAGLALVHAAGLTLDDIETVFAIPPAEAVAAIVAAHGGR